MARVKVSPIIDRISGRVGDLVFRTYGRKVVLSQRPKAPSRPPSPAQVAQRERFRRAMFYGKRVLADPDARAFYEDLAARREKPVLSVAVADFLNVPEVDEIDASAYTGVVGDPIILHAHDDVEVTGVHVTLQDVDGAELEAGAATFDAWCWVYEAKKDVPPGTVVTITARAFDRPGHAGEAEEEVVTSK